MTNNPLNRKLLNIRFKDFYGCIAESEDGIV